MHRFQAVTYFFPFQALWLILLGITITAFSSPKELRVLQEGKNHEFILSFLDHAYQHEYMLADSVLEKNLRNKALTLFFFKGMVHLTRFNDLGDTSSLSVAQKNWENLTDFFENTSRGKKLTVENPVSSELYYGLALIQLGYIYSIRDQYLNSVLKARAGIKILKRQKDYLEAQCAVTVYDYYKSQLLELLNWIPFFKSDKSAHRIFLHEKYHLSPYLSVFFSTPLIWMHFDASMYREGLSLTRIFLAKYPKNRVYRLIEADFLYKIKDYKSSARIFEEIKEEYVVLYNSLPVKNHIKINYLSAVGNLVRVYAAMGDPLKQQENAKIWFSQETRKNQQWLPGSLLRDLERFEE
jgi:hypothetical protein